MAKLNQKVNLVLASPRGFCAGVDRAITIVEKALEIYGTPILVVVWVMAHSLSWRMAV